MRGGDISANPAPRLLFVWEGLIARLPDPEARARRDRHLKRKRWREAIDCYTTDAACAARIYQLAWNYDFAIDVVTFLDREVSPHIKDRLDEERLPYGWLEVTDPGELAHRASWDRGIARIFDPDSDRAGRYGPKGHAIADVRVADLLG